jgi:hypothetical protein
MATLLQTECRAGPSANKMIGLFSRNELNIWMRFGGPHTVDRFANDQNAQLSVFNSKYYCPGSAAVAAFSQCREIRTNWVTVSCILHELERVSRFRAVTTLIVP